MRLFAKPDVLGGDGGRALQEGVWAKHSLGYLLMRPEEWGSMFSDLMVWLHGSETPVVAAGDVFPGLGTLARRRGRDGKHVLRRSWRRTLKMRDDL